MGCRFGVHLRNRDACSKVPLAAQSRSAGLRMPRGGKLVSEGVAARRLCHPRGHHGPGNLFLNDRAIEVVAPLLPTAFPNPAPVIHPTRTAPATQAAAGSGDGPSPPQSGSARHPGRFSRCSPSRVSASVSIKKMPTALAMHTGTRHDPTASHAVTVSSSNSNTHG
jgi:hypothetical protein